MRCEFLLAALCLGIGAHAFGAERRLSLDEYRDKMKGAWIGQMVGVSWGQPTEFKFREKIIPEESVPKWTKERINIDTFDNDDLYVEMTFLKTLERFGLGVTSRQAGIDFANTEFDLWAANLVGRINVRKGIAPPDSSHPANGGRANDLDYQIESDYAGIISPGCPQEVIRLGNVFGRIMNAGDGVWAGQFVGAMYAEAFFTSDVDRILDAGLAAIPEESDYAKMVRDVRSWEREFPDDWTKTWTKINEKWTKNRDSTGGIDVRLNGACIVLGLVYGKSDVDRAMLLSMRCGWDSDCNPSNVGGILMCARGAKNIDEKYGFAIVDERKRFFHTEYTLPDVYRICETLARAIIVKNGGRIERGADGKEAFVIPERSPIPDPFVPSWKMPPPQKLRYCEEEMRQQKFAFRLADASQLDDPDPTRRVQKTLDAVYPGWTTSENGENTGSARTGYLEYVHVKGGEAYEVLCTMPPKDGGAVTLSRTVAVPEGDAKLRFSVAVKPGDESRIKVVVDGTELVQTDILKDSRVKPSIYYYFRPMSVSLAPWAGRSVVVKLVQEGIGGSRTPVFWQGVELVSNAGSFSERK